MNSIQTPVTIFGAGLAGLLAAKLLQGKFENIGVIEAQPSLPNNHSAVLRFRTPVIGDVLNIPFRKVNMIKATVPWRNPVADALAYSYKNTGVNRSDRSINSGLVSDTRYIAPPDLIPRMAEGLNIQFDVRVGKDFFASPADGPIISTLPMPVLMDLLGYEPPSEFWSIGGVNIRATLRHCSAYVSLLVPDPAYHFSRISVTGDEMIIECPLEKVDIENMTSGWEKRQADMAAHLLGCSIIRDSVIATSQRYAKIAPIDDRSRRDFIAWATDKHNVFSLGRFATWRPGLLLDDLVQDIRLIENWIKGSRYDIKTYRNYLEESGKQREARDEIS